MDRLRSLLSAWSARMVASGTSKVVAAALAAAALLVLWRRHRASSASRHGVNALFDRSQLETLSAVTDTIAASDVDAAKAHAHDPVMRDFYLRKASDLKVADLICDALVAFMHPEQVAEFRILIAALDTALGTFLLTGHWGRFASLSVPVRDSILLAWSNSWWLTFRKAFVGLRNATALFYFTALPDGRRNPNWDAIGYPGPPPKPAAVSPSAPRAFAPEQIRQNTILECDAVVVGSGAGGGVCAGVLARAGFRVIVLEKGGYFDAGDLPHTEVRRWSDLESICSCSNSRILVAES
jgi:hypothetical protein